MSRGARATLAAAATLAAGVVAGFALGRATDAAPTADPARAELAGVCHRAGRAAAAPPTAATASALHTVLGLACVPPGRDRARRNAAADAWSAAADRCVADPRACADLAALAEQGAVQLSRGR